MLPSPFDVILSPSALQPASGDTLLALTAFGHGTLLWSVPQKEHLHDILLTQWLSAVVRESATVRAA